MRNRLAVRRLAVCAVCAVNGIRVVTGICIKIDITTVTAISCVVSMDRVTGMCAVR